jgi:hypothetical protein
MPREGTVPYEKLMRAPVSFSHADGLLVFDQTDLGQPRAGSCPELAQVNDNIAIDYLARLDKSDVITGLPRRSLICCPMAWPAERILVVIPSRYQASLKQIELNSRTPQWRAPWTTLRTISL